MAWKRSGVRIPIAPPSFNGHSGTVELPLSSAPPAQRASPSSAPRLSSSGVLPVGPPARPLKVLASLGLPHDPLAPRRRAVREGRLVGRVGRPPRKAGRKAAL